MTYFEDMSPYGYGKAQGVVNVGWLAREHEFATETPEAELIQALYGCCFEAVERYRGHHVCDWCGDLVIVERGERRVCLGNGEVRVGGFAAPTLIAHYVAMHSYRPPEAFVTAVKKLGGTGSIELTFPQLFERKLAAIEDGAVKDALRAAAASPAEFARALTPDGAWLSDEVGRTAWQYLIAARTDPSSIDH